MESINLNTFDQGPYNNFVPEPTQKKINTILWWIGGSLLIVTFGTIGCLEIMNRIKYKDSFQNEN